MIPVRLDPPKKRKYRNTPTWIDGWRFDSIREADCYLVQKQRILDGEIAYCLRQVPIHLAPAGTHKKKPVLMRVDFCPVYHDNTIEFIDAKGVQTRAWVNAAAMAEALYGIRVEAW